MCRLRGTHHDISSICAVLDGSGSTPFSHLSGVMPLFNPFNPERDMKRLYDFSAMRAGPVVRAVSQDE